MEIALIILGSVILGVLARVWVGWASSGEKFLFKKFLATIIVGIAGVVTTAGFSLVSTSTVDTALLFCLCISNFGLGWATDSWRKAFVTWSQNGKGGNNETPQTPTS